MVTTPARISHVQLQYSHTIGRGEQFGPGFTYPIHLARADDDLIYVVCRSSEYRPEGTRITVCTTDEEYVNAFARGVPQQGPHEYNFEDGSLVWPTCVAIAGNGDVFIADEWLNRISIFSRDGEYLGKWEERTGSGDGEFSHPSGIAFDADDNAYVVDSHNHRVQKFTRDGQYLSQFGSFGDGDGEFNMPWGIDIDNQGNIFVADWRNDRIQKFDSEGRFLMKFGSSGDGDGQLNRPTDVAVDQDGIIYVADWLNNRSGGLRPRWQLRRREDRRCRRLQVGQGQARRQPRNVGRARAGPGPRTGEGLLGSQRRGRGRYQHRLRLRGST